MTADELIARLDDVIRYITVLDLPELSDEARERVVGHLTGAVFVTVAPILADLEMDRIAADVTREFFGGRARHDADPAAAGGDPSADTPA